MLLSASGLPRGVAIIRVETPLGRVVLLSDRLSADERRTAQVMACERIRRGAVAVVIQELEVVSVLAEVA